MAPRILIFSIAMGAYYSFYVKSIATYTPTFLRYNNSVLSIVIRVGKFWKEIYRNFLSRWKPLAIGHLDKKKFCKLSSPVRIISGMLDGVCGFVLENWFILFFMSICCWLLKKSTNSLMGCKKMIKNRNLIILSRILQDLNFKDHKMRNNQRKKVPVVDYNHWL